MIQQTDEWYQARVGVVTASRFKDVMSTGRGGSKSKTRESYMMQIVTEMLTGNPCEQFKGNTATEWGNEHEPLARSEYEIKTGNIVNEEGFILYDNVTGVGCSPDGLIGDDGLIEIKCPYNSVNHVETLLNGMPTVHKAQVQGQMWVTCRDWCDFVSYDPRMPEKQQLYVQRIKRDNKYIEDLESKIAEFLNNVKLKISIINGL